MKTVSPEVREELEHAADLVTPLLPPGYSVVICAPDMEVTSMVEYANGTQVYTVKKR